MLRWAPRIRRNLTGGGLGAFLIRALAGTGAVRVASMGATFLVGVQLARLLGVSGYGYYGIALSVITLCGIPGEMGLPRLVTREVAAARVRDDMPHLFGVIRWADTWAIRISALVALGLAVSAAVIAATSASPLALTLIAGAPVVPFIALSRLRGGALQGLHHIVRGQIPANVARPLLQSLLLFGAWAAGLSLSPASAMAINSVGCAAAFALAAWWLKQRLPAAVPAETVRGGRRWLASSIPMAAADGMRILQAEMTILFLGLLTAAADVGLFRVAAATASAAATPIVVVNHVAFAVIAGLHAQKDHVRLQKAVTRFAQAQFVGVLLLSLPLIVAPKMLLTIVFGGEFAAGADAMRILALAQVVNAAFGPNVALLNMTHQERRVTRAMAIGLAVNVAAVFAFARLPHGAGAAVAIFLSLLVWNLLVWHDGRRVLGIDSSIVPLRISKAKLIAGGP